MRSGVEDVVETDRRDIVGHGAAPLAERLDRAETREVVARDERCEIRPTGEKLAHRRPAAVESVLAVGDEALVTGKPFLGQALQIGPEPFRAVAAAVLFAGDERDPAMAMADQMPDRLADPAGVVDDDHRAGSLRCREDHGKAGRLQVVDVARLRIRKVVGDDDQAIGVPRPDRDEVRVLGRDRPDRAPCSTLRHRADTGREEEPAALVAGGRADALHQRMGMSIDRRALVDRPG